MNAYCYMNGGCWYLALAIHRRTGWPMVAVSYSDCPDERSVLDMIAHVAVQGPGGLYYDARGVLDARQFMADYQLGNICTQIPSEEWLLEYLRIEGRYPAQEDFDAANNFIDQMDFLPVTVRSKP